MPDQSLTTPEATREAHPLGPLWQGGGCLSGLALDNVSFAYHHSQPVVEGITARLAPGKLTCIIGPNAAGKTTLLRLMLGQLTPHAGRITLDDRPIARLGPLALARRLAYVPQRGHVSFAFTVRQIVAMGRFAAGPDAAAVDHALAQCDLAHLADRVFNHLSGGQQQLTMIARALAQAAPPQTRNPQSETRNASQALLLDEPAASLDLWHVHRVMQLMRRQLAPTRAIAIVLHDLNLALRYADDVWLIDAGRLAAAGPWHEVMTPAALEPVYRVRLEPVASDPGRRPLFRIEPGDTL